MTATQEPPAAYRRRTSTYVIAFRSHEGWTPEETLDDLIAYASDLGLTIQGSHVHARRPVLVLRLTSDTHAQVTAEDLAGEVQAPVVGIVTGLGVHRREVRV